MPHVEIKCYPGRTEEVKRACAEKVASDVAETLGCPVTAVSVSIKEVSQENWKDVYNGQTINRSNPTINTNRRIISVK